MAVGSGVSVGVGLGVEVGRGVEVGQGVGVGLTVAVGSGVGSGVSSGVGSIVGVSVGAGIIVGSAVGSRGVGGMLIAVDSGVPASAGRPGPGVNVGTAQAAINKRAAAAHPPGRIPAVKLDATVLQLSHGLFTNRRMIWPLRFCFVVNFNCPRDVVE